MNIFQTCSENKNVLYHIIKFLDLADINNLRVSKFFRSQLTVKNMLECGNIWRGYYNEHFSNISKRIVLFTEMTISLKPSIDPYHRFLYLGYCGEAIYSFYIKPNLFLRINDNGNIKDIISSGGKYSLKEAVHEIKKFNKKINLLQSKLSKLNQHKLSLNRIIVLNI